MQRQISLGDLFERGSKRRNQGVRQAIDEADRIGDQELAGIRQADLPDQRFEGDEVRISRFGSRACYTVV
jgi:hypothetical protein